MSLLPNWARKPIHKKEVVASPRGWIVKETGEILKMVKDLDRKLKDNGYDVQIEKLSNVDAKPDVESLEDMLYKPVEEERLEVAESTAHVEESPVEDDLGDQSTNINEKVEEVAKPRRGRRKQIK